MAALLFVGFVAFSAGAQASPALLSTTAASCPHPASYPPAPDATVESSATNVHSGQQIEVSGIRYCPDEDVDITIHGQHVGTGHTDASGSFDPQATVPADLHGAVQLCGNGASGLSTDRDCLELNVGGTGGTGTGSGSTGGGTALTGVEIGGLTALACILLAIGIAFATAGRRKKTAVQG